MKSRSRCGQEGSENARQGRQGVGHETLAESWREEAALFRRRGLHQAADLTESHAADLEAAVREYRLATLTLTAAATESGLKYDTIQGKVASGEIPNAGRRGSPRVRRCDLLSDEVLLARLAGS